MRAGWTLDRTVMPVELRDLVKCTPSIYVVSYAKMLDFDLLFAGTCLPMCCLPGVLAVVLA